MRTFLLATIVGASVAGASVTAVAQVREDDVIASDQAGALDAPETWNCRKIQPEYTRWLRDGNSADSWRYVGNTYRDVDTGELYTWQDWLEWAETANCAALPANTSSSAILIGGAVAAFGTGLIIAANGSGPKSPG